MKNKLFTIETVDYKNYFVNKGSMLAHKIGEDAWLRIPFSKKWYKKEYPSIKHSIYSIEYLLAIEEASRAELDKKMKEERYKKMDKGSIEVILPNKKSVIVKGKNIDDFHYYNKVLTIIMRDLSTKKFVDYESLIIDGLL